jgi:hypothetical protein
MKHFLKIACAAVLAVTAASINGHTQTVVLNGSGSSAYFLDAGLGANYSSGAINAPCVLSENTNIVSATDTSTGSSLKDTGNVWVAWTKGTGGSCASTASGASTATCASSVTVITSG